MAARYTVLDRGLSCGAGRFEPGAFVYGPWLDGQGDSLVRLGVLAPAGQVDDDDPALDADLDVGVPDWLPAPLAGEPAAPVPAEHEDEDEGDDHGDDGDDESDDGDFDADAVLAGSAPEVMALVGDHPDRAEALLTAELAGKNRKGLVTFLEEAVARAEAPEVGGS